MAEQVLLGVSDEMIDEEDDELCTWSTNKFGGYPNWMSCVSERYPSCSVCRRKMALVSQIYCPLTGSQYHRTLYIFGCVTTSCWNQQNSWTILRSQVIDEDNCEEATTATNKASINCSSVDDWGCDAGDWGDVDECSDSVFSKLEYATSKLSLNPMDPIKDTKEIHPSHSTIKPLPSNYINQDVPCFHPYYVNVFEDTSSKETCKTSLTSHEKELLLHYQEQEGMSLSDDLSLTTQVNKNTSEHVVEVYEKTTVAHGDKGFHKFQKYLQHFPQQCLRYEWNGTPLLISSDKLSDIISSVPSCQYCGFKRVFEFQLMPALVNLLKIKRPSLLSPSPDSLPSSTVSNNGLQNKPSSVSENEKVNKDPITLEDISANGQGIEFGTVIVFCCGQSCWNGDTCQLLQEEFAVVQADPDSELFQNKV